MKRIVTIAALLGAQLIPAQSVSIASRTVQMPPVTVVQGADGQTQLIFGITLASPHDLDELVRNYYIALNGTATEASVTGAITGGFIGETFAIPAAGTGRDGR